MFYKYLIFNLLSMYFFSVFNFFQVKDQLGNIIFQDVILTPNEQKTYKIDLKGYRVGHYELLYIEKDITFIGEFEIE